MQRNAQTRPSPHDVRLSTPEPRDGCVSKGTASSPSVSNSMRTRTAMASGRSFKSQASPTGAAPYSDRSGGQGECNQGRAFPTRPIVRVSWLGSEGFDRFDDGWRHRWVQVAIVLCLGGIAWRNVTSDWLQSITVVELEGGRSNSRSSAGRLLRSAGLGRPAPYACPRPRRYFHEGDDADDGQARATAGLRVPWVVDGTPPVACRSIHMDGDCRVLNVVERLEIQACWR